MIIGCAHLTTLKRRTTRNILHRRAGMQKKHAVPEGLCNGGKGQIPLRCTLCSTYRWCCTQFLRRLAVGDRGCTIVTIGSLPQYLDELDLGGGSARNEAGGDGGQVDDVERLKYKVQAAVTHTWAIATQRVGSRRHAIVSQKTPMYMVMDRQPHSSLPEQFSHRSIVDSS